VIVLDLDHFKSVNDRQGHAAGDEVLCWVVETLGRTVRPTDAVGRLGGDEFAILLPDIGAGPAHATMLRVRSALQDRAPCAAGLAVYPDDGTDLDTLTREADLRLYAAREGRTSRAAEPACQAPVVLSSASELTAADAERIQAVLLEEIDASVMVTDLGGTVLSWNRGAESLYGWSREDAVGSNVRELIVPAETDPNRRLVARLRRDSRWDGEMVLRRRDGSTFPAYVRSRLILDAEGRPAAIVGVSVDISSRVQAEDELAQSREYAHAVAECMGEGLITIDEDGRATYANPAAEQMLGWSREELIGQRVHELIHARRPDGSALPAEDCPILRAITDRTSVTIEDDSFITRSGREQAVAYSASPFQTRDGQYGCVVIFHDNTEGRRLAEERRRESETLAWLERVERALAEERLLLYAQPIVELASGRVVQHELLLRMREPDGSIVGPGAFLSIAERHALIGDIDWWVIRRAIQIAALGTPVELNVSARSVGDLDVLDYVERCIEEYGPAPGSVVFELTETAIVEDERAASRFAQRVRALGCEVALDDFGTGYGGFTYLKQIPVDYLKIDIEFVRDLATSQASRHVVQAVVALARDFDLRTVAEGVEDEETLLLLSELGVDFAQGYHLARPEPFSVRPGDQRANGRHQAGARRRRRAAGRASAAGVQ
jgi:PAS domain S-box-containing protein